MSNDPLSGGGKLDDHQLEVIRDYVKYRQSLALDRRGVVSSISLFAWRSLTLLNGGAVVALYTVLGRDSGLHPPLGLTVGAFTFFTLGLVTTLLSATFSFIAQNHFLNSDQTTAEDIFHAVIHRLEYAVEPSRSDGIGERWRRRAIISAFCSLGMFVIGAAIALAAVSCGLQDVPAAKGANTGAGITTASGSQSAPLPSVTPAQTPLPTRS
jgi:hypothetical protein